MIGRVASPRLLLGVFNWLSLLHTLIVRDMRTRFAGDAIGFAWAVIIPVSWIVAITLFFGYLGRSAPIDADLAVFVATGMLPYLVFRGHVTQMLRCLRAQRHLIGMGPAEAEDIFTATSLLEAMVAALVSATVLAATSLYAEIPMPFDPLGVLLALMLAWALGASFGRLAAILALWSGSVIRVVPILLRPFFWISGIFFVASELPGDIAALLWWNPLLHVSELLRSAWFIGMESDFADARIPLIVILGCYLSSRLAEMRIGSVSA